MVDIVTWSMRVIIQPVSVEQPVRRQRALLRKTYERLDRACAAQTPVEGLKTLFDGLRNIKVAGKQEGLSDYWRWVLCIYGPEIMDKFGSFRFLLTDLVPLQLIHEQLMRDSSLAG